MTARIVSEFSQQVKLSSPQASTSRTDRGPVHENVFCDHCNAVIVGIRFKCGMCLDYDLCELCESQRPHQQRSHLFIKIYEPVAATLNQRPLLPSELGATNPFLNLLGSLGVQSGAEATLEVVYQVPLEVRELAQANGCQFYLRDSGRQLCKDYQLVNRSGRHLQAGEYRLEHVFSTGLFPLEAKLPIPEIPEGDVRIMCIAWQLPHQQLMPEDDRPMRQATSVYRVKDRQGKQLGEPITASVAMLLPKPARHQQLNSESHSVQTDELTQAEDAGDDTFELIRDDELPSCFLLTPNISSSPALTPSLHPSEDAISDLDDVINSANYQMISTSPTPEPTAPYLPAFPVPPSPQSHSLCAITDNTVTVTTENTVLITTESTDSVSTESMVSQTTANSATGAFRASVTQALMAPSPSHCMIQIQSHKTQVEKQLPQSCSRPTQAIVQLQKISAAQDTAHPTTILAAAYVPKTSQWVPPPPKPNKPSEGTYGPSGAIHGSTIGMNSKASSNVSSIGGDIWVQRGESSERAKLQKLLEMGFYRRDVNARVLRECDSDFNAALNRLSESYMDW